MFDITVLVSLMSKKKKKKKIQLSHPSTEMLFSLSQSPLKTLVKYLMPRSHRTVTITAGSYDWGGEGMSMMIMVTMDLTMNKSM